MRVCYYFNNTSETKRLAQIILENGIIFTISSLNEYYSACKGIYLKYTPTIRLPAQNKHIFLIIGWSSVIYENWGGSYLKWAVEL